MNVLDNVRSVDNGDIRGIVMEITEIVTNRVEADMKTISTSTMTKVKVVTFPSYALSSTTSDKWEVIG